MQNQVDTLNISIVIPNWNGRHFLTACIESIYRQTYTDFETIVVDCASSDGSVEFLKTDYPQVRVEALDEDNGPAAAINRGVGLSRGHYIVVLNNDVILEDTAMLAVLAEEIAGKERAILNPVELTFSREYLGEGCEENWITPYLSVFLGRTMRNPNGAPFYPSTACCICSKTILAENPLDEDIWMYEDVEWGWRLLLKGYRTITTRRTYYLHKNSGSESEAYSPKQAFFVGRATIATTFMCLSLRYFFLLLPVLGMNCFRHMMRYSRRRKWQSAISYSRGYIMFFRQYNTFRRKRRQLQRERIIDDASIVRMMVESRIFAEKNRANWRGSVFRF